MERWLLENLPPPPVHVGDDWIETEPSLYHLGDVARPEVLAERHYGGSPSAHQLGAVRRALRNLAQQGKALRHPVPRRGRAMAKWSWSLAYTPDQQATEDAWWATWRTRKDERRAAMLAALGGRR